MVNIPSGDELYDLWMLFGRASHGIMKLRAKELAAYHLSPAKAALLFVIYFSDGKVTYSEVVQQLTEEPHSICGLLKRMEKEGLIRKVKEPGGKKSLRVELTETGREAYLQSSKRDIVHAVLSVLSEEERRQMMLSLRKILNKAVEELKYL